MVKLKVKDCMKFPVQSIESTKTIKDAAKLMHEHKIGSLIITKNGKFDIITERDVLKAVAEDKLNLTLDITMEDPLITIDQESSVGRAAQTMLIKGFRRLAVTDNSGKIIGIVNVRDVVMIVHEGFLALLDL